MKMNSELLLPLRYDVFNFPIGESGNQYFFLSSLRKVLESKLVEEWEGQRSLDKKRVIELTNWLVRDYNKNKSINLRGSILLCKKESEEKYYIVDGQHRFRSLEKFLQIHKKDITIRIDVIIVKDNNEIRDEFININKSVPVPFHYLSPNDIINLCCERLRNEFPKSLTSTPSRRPSINIDFFKDTILNEKIIEKHGIQNGDNLYDKLMELNEYYKNLGNEKLQELIGRKNKKLRETVSNGYKKCLGGDYLFLGLFDGTNWVVDI